MFKENVNFKASSFATESNKASILYEVKRTRAVWDPSLAVPGTERRGGFRCPPGTRYGGQITDRFGRNCGWGVARRLANQLTDLGESLENASDKRRNRRNRQPDKLDVPDIASMTPTDESTTKKPTRAVITPPVAPTVETTDVVPPPPPPVALDTALPPPPPVPPSPDIIPPPPSPPSVEIPEVAPPIPEPKRRGRVRSGNWIEPTNDFDHIGVRYRDERSAKTKANRLSGQESDTKFHVVGYLDNAPSDTFGYYVLDDAQLSDLKARNLPKENLKISESVASSPSEVRTPKINTAIEKVRPPAVRAPAERSPLPKNYQGGGVDLPASEWVEEINMAISDGDIDTAFAIIDNTMRDPNMWLPKSNSELNALQDQLTKLVSADEMSVFLDAKMKTVVNEYIKNIENERRRRFMIRDSGEFMYAAKNDELREFLPNIADSLIEDVNELANNGDFDSLLALQAVLMNADLSKLDEPQLGVLREKMTKLKGTFPQPPLNDEMMKQRIDRSFDDIYKLIDANINYLKDNDATKYNSTISDITADYKVTNLVGQSFAYADLDQAKALVLEINQRDDFKGRAILVDNGFSYSVGDAHKLDYVNNSYSKTHAGDDVFIYRREVMADPEMDEALRMVVANRKRPRYNADQDNFNSYTKITNEIVLSLSPIGNEEVNRSFVNGDIDKIEASLYGDKEFKRSQETLARLGFSPGDIKLRQTRKKLLKSISETRENALNDKLNEESARGTLTRSRLDAIIGDLNSKHGETLNRLNVARAELASAVTANAVLSNEVRIDQPGNRAQLSQTKIRLAEVISKVDAETANFVAEQKLINKVESFSDKVTEDPNILIVENRLVELRPAYRPIRNESILGDIDGVSIVRADGGVITINAASVEIVANIIEKEHLLNGGNLSVDDIAKSLVKPEGETDPTERLNRIEKNINALRSQIQKLNESPDLLTDVDTEDEEKIALAILNARVEYLTELHQSARAGKNIIAHVPNPVGRESADGRIGRRLTLGNLDDQNIAISEISRSVEKEKVFAPDDPLFDSFTKSMMGAPNISTASFADEYEYNLENNTLFPTGMSDADKASYVKDMITFKNQQLVDIANDIDIQVDKWNMLITMSEERIKFFEESGVDLKNIKKTTAISISQLTEASKNLKSERNGLNLVLNRIEGNPDETLHVSTAIPENPITSAPTPIPRDDAELHKAYKELLENPTKTAEEIKELETIEKSLDAAIDDTVITAIKKRRNSLKKYLVDRFGKEDTPFASMTPQKYAALSPSEQIEYVASWWDHDEIVGASGKKYKIVPRVSGDSDGFQITATIYETRPDGSQRLVATANRRLSNEENDGLYVYNAYLALPREFQRDQIATIMNGYASIGAASIGITKFKTSPGLDAGPYVWGRLGFGAGGQGIGSLQMNRVASEVAKYERGESSIFKKPREAMLAKRLIRRKASGEKVSHQMLIAAFDTSPQPGLSPAEAKEQMAQRHEELREYFVRALPMDGRHAQIFNRQGMGVDPRRVQFRRRRA